MTDKIFETDVETEALSDPIDQPAASEAKTFTEVDMETRLREARLSWEAERESVLVSEREEMTAEIAALREALSAATKTAARRETEIRCEKMLRERSLGEEMAALLLHSSEADVPDELLAARVDALAHAVEAAAIRAIREKTEGIRPGAGDAAPLTGKIIRETPIAKLAEMM